MRPSTVGVRPTGDTWIFRYRVAVRRVSFCRSFSIRATYTMLILTRRAGEALRIGEDIEVTVMAVNGSQVRIGIKAPRDVAVDRQEIAERKRRDRESHALKQG